MKIVALVVLLCYPVCAALDRVEIVCPRKVTTKSSTSLQAKDPSGKNYNEISGLAVSPSQKAPSGEPVLYGVNDSGGGKRLGVFDSGNGERLLTLGLGFLPSIEDFESLAIGSCGSTGLEDTCIYIADVGDNRARGQPLGEKTQRGDTPYQIIKIREPILGNFADGEEIPASSASILPFDYDDESSPTDYCDSEAVFLDHTGWGGGAVGDLYIVTKWNWGEVSSKLTRLFHIPASVWPTVMDGSLASVYSPVAVGNGAGYLGFVWTSADMTLDGTVIALGDYWENVLFLRCPGMSVAEALDAKYCRRWELSFTNIADQFETFVWAPDGTKVLQMSECGGCNPPMSWTTMKYDTSTEKRCPQVEWSQAPDGNDWYCRGIEDNSIKPDAWCEDWNLVRPAVDNGTDTNSGGSTTPTSPPSIATPAPSLSITTPAPSPSSATSAPSNLEGTLLSVDLSVSTSGSAAPMIGSLQPLRFLLSCLFVIYHL